jgi:hypothetical protein
MAIIFKHKKDYTGYARVAFPDKVNEDEKKIANKISAKINPLKEEAEASGYPFKYVPEKDEYCFLIKNFYLANRVINDTLKNIFITNCGEFQKYNFSYENQLLIFEDLKNVPEHKYDKIIYSHNILNNEEEYEMPEINDALLCIRGISDEC